MQHTSLRIDVSPYKLPEGHDAAISVFTGYPDNLGVACSIRAMVFGPIVDGSRSVVIADEAVHETPLDAAKLEDGKERLIALVKAMSSDEEAA